MVPVVLEVCFGVPGVGKIPQISMRVVESRPFEEAGALIVAAQRWASRNELRLREIVNPKQKPERARHGRS